MLWFPVRLIPWNCNVVLFIHSCSAVWLQLPAIAVELWQAVCCPWKGPAIFEVKQYDSVVCLTNSCFLSESLAILKRGKCVPRCFSMVGTVRLCRRPALLVPVGWLVSSKEDPLPSIKPLYLGIYCSWSLAFLDRGNSWITASWYLGAECRRSCTYRLQQQLSVPLAFWYLSGKPACLRWPCFTFVVCFLLCFTNWSGTLARKDVPRGCFFLSFIYLFNFK